MNKIVNFLKGSLATLLLAVVGLFGLVACQDDGLEQESASLVIYYPEVSNIGPSMNYISGAPSTYGATPSLFSISKVKLNDEAFATDCFSINPSTGAITIANTDHLVPGCYKLSISCLVGSQPFRFEDVFVVNMLPAQPERIEVSQSLLEIPYAEVKTSEAQIEVTPVGESVTIVSWALIQPEGQEYFSISKSGVITVNANFKGEILPGIYPLPVKVSTHAGSTTYEDMVTIKVTSEPLELIYNPAVGRMEYNMGYESNAPAFKGSPEEVSFAIKAVTPETDKVTIDPVTGVLSVEKDAELPVDGHYVVDVTATNLYGTVDFMEAFVLDVIAYIEPIDGATFAYEAVEAIQGTGFEAVVNDDLVGDEVSFSLAEVPAALEGQITIDPATGTITAAKGNTIALGEYAVVVKAANTKNEVTTTLMINIIENPYFFTYIRYGNNLGLDPATYASQYRCATKDEYNALNLVPTTDAKPGVELEWSIEIKTGATKWKEGCLGSTIDPATGKISQNGFSAKSFGILYVTATAGKGKVGETSVTTPVFFSFMQAQSGVTIHYTPFVLQVNPRKGGSSAVPQINGCDDLSKFVLDFRRDFYFWRFGDSELQVDGLPADAGSYLNYMWLTVYNGQEGVLKQSGTGAKNPMSYYVNNDDYKNSALALAYVDPSDFHVVVMPNKWFDANGNPANGVMAAQMTFRTDGNTSQISKGSTLNPLLIWFDEKF